MRSARTLFYYSAFALIISSCFYSCSGNENPSVQVQAAPKDTVQSAGINYSDCNMLLEEARRMDSILLIHDEPDPSSANAAIRAFTDYAHHCRKDSLVPIYLIKTAQVARAMNYIPQAKLALDFCIEDYKEFKDRPAAIFLLAQLYDENTYLSNEYEAQRLYKQIIEEYPKSEWAASAKGALTFIGKSDAEIIKELKKKK